MNDIEAVRVHVASSDVQLNGARPGQRAVYQTITLTTNEIAENLLPQSGGRLGRRKIAFLVALDQAVVIGPNKSDVAAGVGATIPQNTGWPIEDDQAIYVAPSPVLTGTSTARVSISATYEDA